MTDDPSKQVAVITSCSSSGWAEYGCRCLGSMLVNWPSNVKIHLVSEHELNLDVLPTCVKPTVKDRVRVWNLNEYQMALDFYRRHVNNSRVHGRGKNYYDFRLDAYRFSKKIFAIGMVAHSIEAGRLIWLDADTVTLNPIPIDFLRRMPPDGFDIACLDRGRKYHSECGFVGYNLNRPMGREFIHEFCKLYASDTFVQLKEWHDSWVFDWLRYRLKVNVHAIPHNNNSHPFVYSELGEYMDHLKGARKKQGLSTEHPRFKRRKG